jgi:hypothetical protein
MNGQDTLINDIIKLKMQLRGMFIEHYLTREVFTWVWWVGICFTIIPLIIWWKVVDKKRLLEISVFGMIVNISAVFLDVFGSELVLWEYPIRLLPQTLLLFPVDFMLLPVVFMIIYQKCPKWGKFLLLSALSGAALAFIAEPLAIWIGEYRLINWKLIYSFPIYILINIFAKFITGFLQSKQLSQKK